MARSDGIRPIGAFSKAFSRAARDRRKAAKVSQAQWAARIGVNQAYISERETGLRAFTTNDVDVLAELISEQGSERIDGRGLLMELAQTARVLRAVGPGSDDDLTTVHLDPEEIAASEDTTAVDPEREGS